MARYYAFLETVGRVAGPLRGGEGRSEIFFLNFFLFFASLRAPSASKLREFLARVSVVHIFCVSSGLLLMSLQSYMTGKIFVF